MPTSEYEHATNLAAETRDAEIVITLEAGLDGTGTIGFTSRGGPHLIVDLQG